MRTLGRPSASTVASAMALASLGSVLGSFRHPGPEQRQRIVARRDAAIVEGSADLAHGTGIASPPRTGQNLRGRLRLIALRPMARARFTRRVLTGACMAGCLALAAACTTTEPAQPATPPPANALSPLYVPGNQKLFEAGVEAFDAKDYAAAFKIFSDLSKKGDIAALRNVAFMQREGLGTEKDIKAALDNYETAAVAGLPTAQADLGQMLLDGEAGKPDPGAALYWLRKAAESNHPVAQYLLGTMYEAGNGVDRDLDRAKTLYAAAAAHGDKQALSRLAALKGWPAPGTGTAAAATARTSGLRSSEP